MQNDHLGAVYQITEEILGDIDDSLLQAYLSELGFKVDSGTIMSKDISGFAARERLTRSPTVIDKETE